MSCLFCPEITVLLQRCRKAAERCSIQNAGGNNGVRILNRLLAVARNIAEILESLHYRLYCYMLYDWWRKDVALMVHLGPRIPSRFEKVFRQKINRYVIWWRIFLRR